MRRGDFDTPSKRAACHRFSIVHPTVAKNVSNIDSSCHRARSSAPDCPLQR
jgi:hypothetical protein